MQQESPDTNIATTKSEAGATTRARAAEEALHIDAWQRVNTALYWHVEPSLLLVGPDKARDERFMDATSIETEGFEHGAEIGVDHLSGFILEVIEYFHCVVLAHGIAHCDKPLILVDRATCIGIDGFECCFEVNLSQVSTMYT